MKLKYKIIETNIDDHSMVVRFFTEMLSEHDLSANEQELVEGQWRARLRADGTPTRCRTDYSIEIPILAPDAAELDELISRNAPRMWLERKEILKSAPVSMGSVGDIINQVRDVAPPPLLPVVDPIPVTQL